MMQINKIQINLKKINKSLDQVYNYFERVNFSAKHFKNLTIWTYWVFVIFISFLKRLNIYFFCFFTKPNVSYVKYWNRFLEYEFNLYVNRQLSSVFIFYYLKCIDVDKLVLFDKNFFKYNLNYFFFSNSFSLQIPLYFSIKTKFYKNVNSSHFSLINLNYLENFCRIYKLRWVSLSRFLDLNNTIELFIYAEWVYLVGYLYVLMKGYKQLRSDYKNKKKIWKNIYLEWSRVANSTVLQSLVNFIEFIKCLMLGNINFFVVSDNLNLTVNKKLSQSNQLFNFSIALAKQGCVYLERLFNWNMKFQTLNMHRNVKSLKKFNHYYGPWFSCLLKQLTKKAVIPNGLKIFSKLRHVFSFFWQYFVFIKKIEIHARKLALKKRPLTKAIKSFFFYSAILIANVTKVKAKLVYWSLISLVNFYKKLFARKSYSQRNLFSLELRKAILNVEQSCYKNYQYFYFHNLRTIHTKLWNRKRKFKRKPKKMIFNFFKISKQVAMREFKKNPKKRLLRFLKNSKRTVKMKLKVIASCYKKSIPRGLHVICWFFNAKINNGYNLSINDVSYAKRLGFFFPGKLGFAKKAARRKAKTLFQWFFHLTGTFYQKYILPRQEVSHQRLFHVIHWHRMNSLFLGNFRHLLKFFNFLRKKSVLYVIDNSFFSEQRYKKKRYMKKFKKKLLLKKDLQSRLRSYL